MSEAQGVRERFLGPYRGPKSRVTHHGKTGNVPAFRYETLVTHS